MFASTKVSVGYLVVLTSALPTATQGLAVRGSKQGLIAAYAG